ncbi:MAG: hypothetical protein AAFY82_08455 [Pseudomonadota bacterium]
MIDQSMTPDRVIELIEAYGAEPGAWPEDERGAAILMLAEQPARFEAALDQARALDALIASEPDVHPSAALGAAILAQAPVAKAERSGVLGQLSAILFPQGMRWPAGAAVASLLMGLVGGYAYASTGVGYDQADAAYYAAFGYDTSEDWMSLE